MPTPQIEACFRQILLDAAAVTALVESRIHIAHRPQGDTLPSLVVRKLDAGVVQTNDRDYSNQTPQVMVEVYDDSHFDAATLGDLVATALVATNGTITVKKSELSTFGTRVVSAVVLDETADYEPPPVDGTDIRGYSRALSFWCLTTGS